MLNNKQSLILTALMAIGFFVCGVLDILDNFIILTILTLIFLVILFNIFSTHFSIKASKKSYTESQQSQNK